MKKIAIIVAGGQGIRMKGSLPKQFIDLCGEPILFHTLRKFESVGCQIILVMNPSYIDFWKSLCADRNFEVKHEIVSGGSTRAESVKNGVQLVGMDALIAVHDAVRPLLTVELIEELFNQANIHGAVIPVLEVKDSLRQISETGSAAVVRSNYKIVQTPQVFISNLLKEAFNVDGYEKFTDEASLVEATGIKIHLINGEETNIKITNPIDLIVAEKILASN
jgi:2-C-methyl-D-erythritol 4-phosphate cytidylyltransferase